MKIDQRSFRLWSSALKGALQTEEPRESGEFFTNVSVKCKSNEFINLQVFKPEVTIFGGVGGGA